MNETTVCTTNDNSCCGEEAVTNETQKQRKAYRPRTDVVDGPDNLTFYVEMPGVNETGVDVTLEDQVLSIRGSVEVPEKTDNKKCHTEYGVGDYERHFKLATQINRDGMNATMKDGVLILELPKVKPAGPTKVAIKAG